MVAVSRKRKVAAVTEAVAEGSDTGDAAPPTGARSRKQSAASAAHLSEHDFGSKDELPPGTLMCMRTAQTAQWRSLIDFLKDLITECPVTFNADGMVLKSLDPHKVALLHLQVEAEFCYCPEPIIVGINMIALYKMIRNLTTGGYLLELSLTAAEPDVLAIKLINSDKRTSTVNKLKLLKLPKETLEIPSTNFQRVLTIPSSDLQRYIKELAAISNRIRITSRDDLLILKAEGAVGSSEIQIRPTASGMHWVSVEESDEGTTNEVSGLFYSKFLERFTRPLDSICEVFLKESYPLVIRFVLASAVLRAVLAPLNDDDLVED